MTAQTTWPEGVIARYVNVGGATVDVSERSAYYGVTEPTETRSECTGCGKSKTFEWGWDVYAVEYGRPQSDEFDRGGRRSTPKARDWAQAHAEFCRAMPRPEVAP